MRLLFCLILSLFPVSALASSAVTIDQSWAVPPVKGMSVGVAYVTLTNHGDASATLTSVSGDVSNVIELHTHVMDGDIMKMRKLDSLTIEPHQTVTFKPGGLHLMLIGLKSELAVGDSFPVTLHFGDDTLKTDIVVQERKVPAAAPAAAEKDHHEHHH